MNSWNVSVTPASRRTRLTRGISATALTVALLLTMLTPPASAEYSTEDYRPLADQVITAMVALVSAINVCDVSVTDELPPPPFEVGCSGDYNIEAGSTGATVEADFDAFACVGTSCVVIPATLSQTGGFVDADATVKTGETVLLTIPQVCLSGICVNNEPQPVTGVDPNNYFVSLFSSADEVEIYHPFSSDPITADLGDFVIDGGGGTDA